MKKVLQQILPIFFLGLIFFLLFYKVFLQGAVFYEGDNFHLNIPEKYFFVQEVSHGHIPLWNPYLFLGIPNAADFNLGAFNITNIIYFLFPVARALTLLTVIELFVFSCGVYVLLRQQKLSQAASFFGASIASLGGMPFIFIGNITFLSVIVFVPFLFLVLYRFYERRTIKWFLLLCLLQFLQFIAGHPQITYFTFIFVAASLLFFSPFYFRKRLVLISVYLFTPLLLSSFQLVPFLEFVMHANRAGQGIGYATTGSISLPNLATFLFPTFYGSHADGTWWGTQQMLTGFIGIPSLVFLLVAIRRVKIKYKKYYLYALGFSLLFALGKVTPIFFLFYYLFPGGKLFRDPSILIFFYTFLAAMLCAFGLRYYEKHAQQFVDLGKKLFIISGIGTLISLVVYLIGNKPLFWFHFFQKIKLEKILFYDPAKIQTICQGILANILLVSVSFALTGVVLLFLSRKSYTSLLLIAITVVGLCLVDTKAILLTSSDLYTPSRSLPAVLRSVVNGQYRILSIPVNLHQNKKYLPSKNFFLQEAKDNLSLYMYDNNMQYDLYQVNGYISQIPQNFSQFINPQSFKNNITGIDFSRVTQQQLNLSSVRFILSVDAVQQLGADSLKLVEKDKGRYIYENTQAYQRAYVLEDPYGKHITFQTISPVRISFMVHVSKPSSVIVTDWYYPGWKAVVNGKEVQSRSYKNVFQEISVPAGASSVSFTYKPLSFTIGMILSGIGLLGLIIAFVFLRKKKL